MDGKTAIVAGTTIARLGWAALIRGRSGQGKSDLALRAITQQIQLPTESAATAFSLVSDDQTCLEALDGDLICSPPETLRGLLEVRGIGIISAPSVADVPLALIVDLDHADVERLPEYPGANETMLGCTVDVVHVSAHEVSAPLKVALALARSAKRRASTT